MVEPLLPSVMESWRDDFPPINLWNMPKMISEKDVSDYKNDSYSQPETTRGSILNEANSIVNGARANVYGGPEDSFRTIAGLWSTYLSRAGRIVNVGAADVASMMALLKIARIQNSPDHRDSWVDIAGYAACGAECGLKGKNEGRN